MFDDNFLEKMMELGIGLNVMKQMPNMMDGIIPAKQSKQVSPTPPPLNAKNAITYIAVNGQQAGPLTDEELTLLIKHKIVTDETLVWTPQLTQWTQAKMVPSVNKLLIIAAIPTTTAKKTSASSELESPIKDEVVSALSELGYKDAATQKIIKEVLSEHPEYTSSEAIKEVLKHL